MNTTEYAKLTWWMQIGVRLQRKANKFFLCNFVIACFYLLIFEPLLWDNDVFAQYEGWIQNGPTPVFNIEDHEILGIGIKIAVGRSGHVIKTTDGGENWTNLPSVTTIDLHAISIPGGEIGYVVGDSGKIICTTLAGMNWFDLNSGTTNDLYGVSFTDDSTGTAVGDNGTIIKTTDWGTTWNPQSSGTTNILYDVYAIDQQKAVAVGAGGIILRTDNGGANWTQPISGTTEDLLAVDGHGANKLIATGNNGIILHSISAGMIWMPRVSGTLVHLPDVILLDEPTASVVGYNGTILRTTDGGITWVPQESGTTENLLSVSFYDKNNGSAAGENGTVLHTKTGGRTLPIIFVDNSKPNGDGSFTNPFNNLADVLNAADSVDSVYVMNSDDTPYLIDGKWGYLNFYQKFLIGQGVELKWEGFSLVPASTPPVITNQNGHGVTVTNGTTITGIRIDNCNGAGIYAGPDVTDSVRVIQTTISGGKSGIKIDGSSGKFIFSNVDIINTDGPNFSLMDSGGSGSNSADVTFTGQITQSDSAAAVDIQDHSGTVNFTAGSTINATNGNGLQFNNADGIYNLNGATTLNGGAGIHILGGSDGSFLFNKNTLLVIPRYDPTDVIAFSVFNIATGRSTTTYEGDVVPAA